MERVGRTRFDGSSTRPALFLVDECQFTRIGHIPGGGRPLLRDGGPISYNAGPSLSFHRGGKKWTFEIRVSNGQVTTIVAVKLTLESYRVLEVPGANSHISPCLAGLPPKLDLFLNSEEIDLLKSISF